MATSTTSNSYVYRHDNFTVSTVSQKKMSRPIDYLLINNVDGSNDAQVSFDGGINFLTIAHKMSLELFPAKLQFYFIGGVSGNSVNLECLYGSEA